MPQPDEADPQPGAPPAQPENESFSPDDAAQPVELQSPEGELPLEVEQSDVAQPVEAVSAEEAPADGAQLSQDAYADDYPATEEPQPDVGPPYEAATVEEPQPEIVAPQPEPRQLSRRERDILDRQNRRFAACGRCGYFVADCRNYLGEAVLVEAMLDGEDGWLRLEGDETFRRLLTYAYGVPLDNGYDYFDGSCPECRRRFVYMARADHPTRLKIQI